MAENTHPKRRWALFATAVLGLGGFVMSTGPDDVQSNLSKWLELLPGIDGLPAWLLSPQVDTIGMWGTGSLAALSFVWFMSQYVPVTADWLNGQFGVTAAPESALTHGHGRRIKTSTRTRKRWMGRLGTRFRWVWRSFSRWLRLYVPWDYEIRRCEYGTASAHVAWLRDDRQSFWLRIGDAFPGKRDVYTTNNTRQIIRHLDILLRWPAQAIDAKGGTVFAPFYFLMGPDHGNLHVQSYARYKRNVVILNRYEFRPTFMAAFCSDVYWQNFVYLECEGMPVKSVKNQLPPPGGAKVQQYAIYKNRVISYEEHGDGSFIRCGRIIRMKHHSDVRIRPLTPFGFLLMPNSSSANSGGNVDVEIERLIGKIINNKNLVDALEAFLLSLPKGKNRPRND